LRKAAGGTAAASAAFGLDAGDARVRLSDKGVPEPGNANARSAEPHAKRTLLTKARAAARPRAEASPRPQAKREPQPVESRSEVIPPKSSPSREAASREHDPEQIRFRILQRGKWRRAIKLEGIFWTALESIAARQGMKLTDYVQAFLDTRPGSNQTAELRTHAARWLHERLTATEERLNGFGPGGMLQAVPLPGFIIGRGLGLIAFNADFLHLIRRVAACGQGEEVPSARLNLDAPLASIIERLREAAPRPLECGFTLAINRRASRGRVRVCIAPGPDGRDDIMGFVLALKEDVGSGSGVAPNGGGGDQSTARGRDGTSN
jgi:predicted DNA-binding ribbon-helix-helix protein